ncbi:hypothetical protein [Thioalkalivibrio sp. HK1]|uniref:hypothetical protein n=1 Tax=Thioalkalivibrio sp. HK1 TaxID=1469245 RepID=UPI000472BAB7|nr:hypothetical protein [Thioalkalivibrio sp. HK1]
MVKSLSRIAHPRSREAWGKRRLSIARIDALAGRYPKTKTSFESTEKAKRRQQDEHERIGSSIAGFEFESDPKKQDTLEDREDRMKTDRIGQINA